MGKHSNENYNETYLHQQFNDLEFTKIKRNVYIYTTDRKREFDDLIKSAKIKVVIRTVYKILRNRKPIIDYWIYRRK